MLGSKLLALAMLAAAGIAEPARHKPRKASPHGASSAPATARFWIAARCSSCSSASQPGRPLLVALLVRRPPDAKAPAQMTIQLPLGLNLTEAVQIKVDNGAAESQPIQTCTNIGCFVSMTSTTSSWPPCAAARS